MNNHSTSWTKTWPFGFLLAYIRFPLKPIVSFSDWPLTILTPPSHMVVWIVTRQCSLFPQTIVQLPHSLLLRIASRRYQIIASFWSLHTFNLSFGDITLKLSNSLLSLTCCHSMLIVETFFLSPLWLTSFVYSSTLFLSHEVLSNMFLSLITTTLLNRTIALKSNHLPFLVSCSKLLNYIREPLLSLWLHNIQLQSPIAFTHISSFLSAPLFIKSLCSRLHSCSLKGWSVFRITQYFPWHELI